MFNSKLTEYQNVQCSFQWSWVCNSIPAALESWTFLCEIFQKIILAHWTSSSQRLVSDASGPETFDATEVPFLHLLPLAGRWTPKWVSDARIGSECELNRLSTWSLNIVHMDSECWSTLVDSVCQTLDMGRADQHVSVAKSNSVLLSSHGCQSFILTDQCHMWTALVKKINNIWET